MLTLTELVLVVLLGHDSFPIRQAAQKGLEAQMNHCLYEKLQHFKSDDLETNRRVELARSDYENRLVRGYETALKGYKDYPFIDSLPDGYCWNNLSKQAIVQKYLQQHWENPDGHQWWNYRRATQQWFWDRRFEDTDVLKNDLELLKLGDDAWWKRSGQVNPMR